METKNFYKCFISSPGDCDEERAICDRVIEKINNGLASHLNVNFSTFKWENDVLLDINNGGQDIIDESVEKADYDIFIGIMRYRFGTPTKIAGSGTEHEFIKAMEKKQKNPALKIFFFFSNENTNPKTLDYDQFLKVQKFKTQIGQQGIYADYFGRDEFEKFLEIQLELFVKEFSSTFQPSEKIETIDNIRKKLEIDLRESLKSFNEDAPVWIEPIISSERRIPQNPSKNLENQIDIDDIISSGQSVVIKAPAEFGLTSLSHYIKLEAWKKGKTFVYCDLKTTKQHKIINEIIRSAENGYNKKTEEIDCILLDSAVFEASGVLKMVKNVSDHFKTTPIILMNTIDNEIVLINDKDDEEIKIDRDFLTYYMLPLRQDEMRKIVSEYSLSKSFKEDNDIILTKVTRDLEVLNIHRTPKNCLTILKASYKIGLEHSPINRTKLLDTILSIIFDEYEIPTYKSKKPDINDCRFALGYLCELLIKKNNYEFTEDFFKKELRVFCDTNYIELDLNFLYSVLIDNSIISARYGEVSFKNAYWLFYFSAHRMNLNLKFKEYIFSDKKYIDFPVIMEFYTGIDRNKEDALKILLEDIKETIAKVRSKVQLSGDLNPYKSISWNPNLEALAKEEEKISKNVISSGLPDEVKDKYNDKRYNQTSPYNQVINTVMREYSIFVMTRQLSASSRALRNSDFVNSELKKEVLNEILEAWSEFTKVLIALSPILADKGDVAIEGTRFELDPDDFQIDNAEEKRFAVLLAVPKNVVDYFKNDLFSNKMAPLISEKALNESNSLLKHQLMLMISSERPSKWNTIIDSYIISLDKNSYFLSDIANSLNVQLDYHVTEVDDRRILGHLLHKCRAKHIFSKNNPDIGLINRARKL